MQKNDAKGGEREQRLAEALRANLRRRKDQQRGLAAPRRKTEAGDDDSPSSPPAGTD